MSGGPAAEIEEALDWFEAAAAAAAAAAAEAEAGGLPGPPGPPGLWFGGMFGFGFFFLPLPGPFGGPPVVTAPPSILGSVEAVTEAAEDGALLLQLLPPMDFASGLSIHQLDLPVPSFWTRMKRLWRDRLWRIEFWKREKGGKCSACVEIELTYFSRLRVCTLFLPPLERCKSGSARVKNNSQPNDDVEYEDDDDKRMERERREREREERGERGRHGEGAMLAGPKGKLKRKEMEMGQKFTTAKTGGIEGDKLVFNIYIDNPKKNCGYFKYSLVN